MTTVRSRDHRQPMRGLGRPHAIAAPSSARVAYSIIHTGSNAMKLTHHFHRISMSSIGDGREKTRDYPLKSQNF